MYRRGHQGLVLLVLAPIEYLFLRGGQPFLAFLVLFGVVVIEPLPDTDQKVPWLRHRGTSHSLCSAILIGLVLAGIGWFAGQHVLGGLSQVAAEFSRLTAEPLHMSTFADGPTWLRSGFAGLSGTLDWIATRLGGFDNRTLAVLGFAIGAGGIVIHLLGDVITISGIQPFLPVSDWHLSVSRLRADSTGANMGFFALGILAFVVVLSVTVPGVGLGTGIGMPSGLSPVGAVQAQNTSHAHAHPHNGSVQINEQASNRSRIIVANVTLPQNGFIVAETGNRSTLNRSEGQVLGHTQFVRHGSFQQVVLALDTPIQGHAPVSVALRNDTNGNEKLDGPNSTKPDHLYRTSNGTPVGETFRLGASDPQKGKKGGKETPKKAKNHEEQKKTKTDGKTPSATVELDASNNTTVKTIAVSTARLPDGGFVVIHDSSYAEGNTLYAGEITVSRYLSPGTHHNLRIPVKRGVPGSPNVSRVNATRENLSALVFRDTNHNHHYEFATSYGKHDGYYETTDGDPVADTKEIVFEDNLKRAKQRAQPASATLQFQNQRLHRANVNGSSTIRIRRVTLEHGGFVAVHNQSYAPPTNDPLGSTIGISRYLSPGTHRNVSIRVLTGSVTHTQRLIAVPYLDTNHNHNFDYIHSGGERDYAYIRRSNGSIVVVNESAIVRVPAPNRSPTTRALTSGARSASPSATGTTAVSTTSAPSGNARRSGSGGNGDQSRGVLGFGLLVKVVIVVVIGGLAALLGVVVLKRRMRGQETE